MSVSHQRLREETKPLSVVGLFHQEAYKMVDEAKGEKLIAEKRLADASGRVRNCTLTHTLASASVYTPLHHSHTRIACVCCVVGTAWVPCTHITLTCIYIYTHTQHTCTHTHTCAQLIKRQGISLTHRLRLCRPRCWP